MRELATLSRKERMTIFRTTVPVRARFDFLRLIKAAEIEITVPRYIPCFIDNKADE